MLTVEEAQTALLSRVHSLPAERAPLLQARGMVLAEDIFADIDNPPFDNSAVDGYAVRSEDTRGANKDSLVLLRELSEVAAGAVSTLQVEPGTCIRVMTGAPFPAGADAMVMVEDSSRSADGVRILAPARPGAHIRRAAEDIPAGACVLSAGTLIGPAEIAVLAAVGRPEPPCVRRPRVAVISTGDELVDPASRPGPGQIRDTNRPMAAALVEEAGARLHAMRHVPDDEASTEEALASLAGLGEGEAADVIVTSGGVSVGDRDFVKPVLERLGTLDFWRVRMKPGKPVAVGRIANTLFFGLPGNPVSTMVTFELFVRPVLWKLAGRADVTRARVRATLDAGVEHSPGREEFVRAAVRMVGGQFHAAPTGAQGSGMLTSMLGANALLAIPAQSASLSAGDAVEALLLGAPFGTTYGRDGSG